MARTYERAGKPSLPKWWTDVVFPRLKDKDVDYGEIAAKASIYANRKSAWKRDAISKFVSGSARTRELANGISLALGVDQPYFTARSAKESCAIKAVMDAVEGPTVNPEQQARLIALDQAGEGERKSAIDQSQAILSQDDEGTSGRGRVGRTTRRRS